MQKIKTQKGITLIALIITIIVMLILVGVTIIAAIDGGAFSKAREAKSETEKQTQREAKLLSDPIEIDGKKYATYEDYINNNYIIEWGKVETKPEGWSNNVVAMTDGDSNVPVPNGFEILTTSERPYGYSIDEGFVIKDGENEFVWVPVTNAKEYTEDDFGPLEYIDEESNYKYDSYQIINHYYGNVLGTMKSNTDFDSVFTYAVDKANVERSIKTYGGFYVGRYETTYDRVSEGVPQGIGVKKGRDVLRADCLLKPETETKPASNENYYYRWWGLYKAQKDLYNSNLNVGSLMISDNQWEAIMDYTKYREGTRPKNSYSYENGPDKSGSAYSTDPNKYDKVKNIYDLASNLEEWTMEASTDLYRIDRGGDYENSDFTASHLGHYYPLGYSRKITRF